MNILTIASTITAITAIVTAIYKVLKLIDKLQDKYEELTDLLNENTLLTYKIVLVNEKFSLKERIEAGEKYLKMKDDAYVRKVVARLLEEYDKEITE